MTVQNPQDQNNFKFNFPPPSSQPTAPPSTKTADTTQTQTVASAANLTASTHLSETKGTVATHHLPSSDSAKLSQPKESTIMNMLRSAWIGVRNLFNSAFRTTAAKVKEGEIKWSGDVSKFKLKGGLVEDKSTKPSAQAPIDPRSQKIKSLTGEIREQERLKTSSKAYVDHSKFDNKIDQYKKQIEDLQQEIAAEDDDALDKAMEELKGLGGGELEANIGSMEDLYSITAEDMETHSKAPSKKADSLVDQYMERNVNLQKLQNKRNDIKGQGKKLKENFESLSDDDKQTFPQQRAQLKDELKAIKQEIHSAKKSMSPLSIKLAELKIHKENREFMINSPTYKESHITLKEEIALLDQVIEKLEGKFNKQEVKQAKVDKTQSKPSTDAFESINKKLDKLKLERAHLKDEIHRMNKEIKNGSGFSKLFAENQINDIKTELQKLDAAEKELKQERAQMEIDRYLSP